MMGRKNVLLLLSTMLVCAPASVRAGSELTVIDVDPSAHSLVAPVTTSIRVTFDRPVLRSSVVALRSFWAFGRWSGTVGGLFLFGDDDRTVTLIPDRPFSAGETVMVILSHDLEGADGTSLRAEGYSYQFWTRATLSPMAFAEVQRMSTRSDPGQTSRAYGGIASDLNADGYPDITIVNEVTADLRVFLNRADKTAMFHDFIEPPFPVGVRASPSEPSDFNRDGNVDICISNIDANTVSVLLGSGDGTFGRQQVIPVGVAPRGIAVLDVDGDGDTDIVNTNLGTNRASLILNDGNGRFGDPEFLEDLGDGEWALAAGDMNDDGILDLVVGSQFSETIVVALGDGAGGFTPSVAQDSDGSVWMLVLGDVDGNGTEDVASVNSSDNRSAILLGRGDGTFEPPVRYPSDPFPLATDLGDLDGDGDLDWVTSSFGGDWLLFTNDGAGQFTLREEFPATVAASCSLLVDVDRDGDLDIALIDEIADEVIIMQNSGGIPIPTLSTWSTLVLTLLILTAGTLMTRRRRGGYVESYSAR